MVQKCGPLAASLVDGKIHNGGCVGMEVEWDARGKVRIMDLKLMFGTHVDPPH